MNIQRFVKSAAVTTFTMAYLPVRSYECSNVFRKDVNSKLTVTVYMCSLQRPLLCRREGVLSVNLDLVIVSMLEEAKWMRRLGYKIPPSFQTITLANVKQTHSRIKVLADL